MNVILIFILYLAMFFLAFTAEKLGLVFRFVALILIAALQNHLQILQHEAAHFHLCKNRKLNDVLGSLFCSIPFFGFLLPYRKFHFTHHRFLGHPEKDPEIDFYRQQGYTYQPLSRCRRLWMYFKDLNGYHYGQFTYAFVKDSLKGGLALNWETLLFAVFWIGFFTVGAETTWAGKLAFYWLVPQPTLLFFLLKQQGYSEHTGRHGSVFESTQFHRFGF